MHTNMHTNNTKHKLDTRQQVQYTCSQKGIGNILKEVLHSIRVLPEVAFTILQCASNICVPNNTHISFMHTTHTSHRGIGNILKEVLHSIRVGTGSSIHYTTMRVQHLCSKQHTHNLCIPCIPRIPAIKCTIAMAFFNCILTSHWNL